MNYFKSFSERLLKVETENFKEMALELFEYQVENNPIYKKYIQARRANDKKIQELKEIPFLPIRFFKDQVVYSGKIADRSKFYSSSGTSGTQTSKHYFWSESFYHQHALKIFESQYGSISGYHILALLPSYLERRGSSLVSMVDFFIKESGSEHSGFYLYNFGELIEKLHLLKSNKKKVLLLGVTFALLDLADIDHAIPKMNNLILMETGGMKGRKKEMVRTEVHEKLKSCFFVDHIHSEYGMTELMSQAYSKGGGKYNLPHSMHVVLRDVNDPYDLSAKNQGGINVIDLANFHSCAFIETQDLGKIDQDGKLEVLGRFDNSDIRGCNLLVH